MARRFHHVRFRRCSDVDRSLGKRPSGELIRTAPSLQLPGTLSDLISMRHLTLLVAVLPLMGACSKSASKSTPKSTAPAHVEAHPDEAHVFQVSLTDNAVQRLGIQTGEITRQHVPRRRTYGGEVVIPPGNLISGSTRT